MSAIVAILSSALPQPSSSHFEKSDYSDRAPRSSRYTAVPGLSLQIEDAMDDVSKQLSQVQNFIANKVDS